MSSACVPPPSSASSAGPADVVLLVSGDCAPCVEAAQVWGAACAELGRPLRCVDVDSAAGRELVERLSLHSVPVLLVGGVAMVVGVPDAALAHRVLAKSSAHA